MTTTTNKLSAAGKMCSTCRCGFTTAKCLTRFFCATTLIKRCKLYRREQYFTHPLVNTTMTILIDGVVGVAGVCSYTCKLGIFFVMPLTLPMLNIFEKISVQGALEKFDKNLTNLKKSNFYVR